MTDEGPDSNKNDALVPRSGTSTPRTLRHQMRPALLLQLVERAVSAHPELRQALAQAMAEILAGDQDFATLLQDVLAPPRRGPTPAARFSPLITGLHNVLNVAPDVLNVAPNVLNEEGVLRPDVLNVAPNVVNDQAPPAPLPPPRTTLHPVPKPTPPPKTSAPTGLTRAAAAMRGDPHWLAMEEIFGPCRSNPEWEQRFQAITDAKDGGNSPEALRQGAHNWKRKMGFTMTPSSLVKYLGQALNGPDLGEDRHNRTVTEVGTRFHEESFSQLEARRGSR